MAGLEGHASSRESCHDVSPYACHSVNPKLACKRLILILMIKMKIMNIRMQELKRTCQHQHEASVRKTPKAIIIIYMYND